MQSSDNLIQATWVGDPKIMYANAAVEVLASDPNGVRPRHWSEGEYLIFARTACWIRHWPADSDYPEYRSCDMCDLELSDEDRERLIAMPMEKA
jgi:hypothetical protein